MQNPKGLISPMRVQTVTCDSVIHATCGVNVKFSPPAAGETRIHVSAVIKRNSMKCVRHEMKEAPNGSGDTSYAYT
jgi:hypothetical protein